MGISNTPRAEQGLLSWGAAFDNKAKLPGERIAQIVAPTLIIHAADDTLQLYHDAVFAVATVPNASLIRFNRGGHFLIGVAQQTISEAVQNHILKYIDAVSR